MSAFLALDKQHKIIASFLIGPLLETCLYGIYFYLCLSVLAHLVRQGTLHTRVTLSANALMFILITVHEGIISSQTITAFASAKTIYPPLEIVLDLRKFSITFAGVITLLMVLAVGDFIMIYRCFQVWQRRYSIIAVPLLISILGVVTHSINLYKISKNVAALLVSMRGGPMFIAPFTLHFVQGALTTGLIVYRIWSQLREARGTMTSRPRSVHVPSIMAILRIMVESAMIYTIAMLGMVVLVYMGHPAQYIGYCCLVPITGITFALMSLRTHGVCEEAKNLPLTPSILLSWRLGDNSRRE